jgi:hypothetical protein
MITLTTITVNYFDSNILFSLLLIICKLNIRNKINIEYKPKLLKVGF